MARFYPATTDKTHCEDCGEELEPFVYRGLKLGCPGCIPDGLVEKYHA